jgi:hypothetical protein
MALETRFPAVTAALLTLAGVCSGAPAAPAPAVPLPHAVEVKMGDPEVGAPAVGPELKALAAPALETRAFPVGTRGSDVRVMLQAVRGGKRADIPVPAAFGDLAVEVTTARWPAAVDWDGDGRPELLLLRTAVVPDLDERPTAVSWLLVVPTDDAGAVGPDEEKRAVLLYGAAQAGAAPALAVSGRIEGRGGEPLLNVQVGTPAGVAVLLRPAKAGEPAGDPARALAADRVLVEGAGLVFDRFVLAPETAYVKAFIRKEFEKEVERVEPVRGLAVPEVLRPLYGALTAAAGRLAAAPAEGAPGWLPRARATARILLREADQSLRLTAAEYHDRVESLQGLSKQWRAMEAALSYDGQPLRRVDFETRIVETADAQERRRLARAYEAAFAPLYAADGDYARMVARLNEIARRGGYRNYADLRLEEVFGLPADDFRRWIEDAFAATEELARRFLEDLRAEKGGGELGYWEVQALQKEWLKARLGLPELPKLSEQEARAILRRHLLDLGFDLEQAPYDRVTMDWYQDPLKQDAAGVAATATPFDAYFTSNLKPGQPIPLNEYETVVHETLHTLHYQTSGAASGGSSAFQNLMYSYIAEGITMSGESLPVATPALMKRYFGGLEGFDERLMAVYPAVQQVAEAWDLRRLVVMALMEVELYEDRRPDGSERPWAERLQAWPKLLAERLWVVPDGIELGQILCRMHPTAEQHQLMYASYPLGRILVGQLRDAIVKDGTPEELARYGVAVRELMAQGALADQPSVKALIAKVLAESGGAAK